MYSVIINSTHSEKICVISYNSRGFGPDKQEFCIYLLSNEVCGDSIPVLCVQENFLMRGNIYKLHQTFSNYYPVIKPAEKVTNDRGRARNGMFMVVPDYMKNNICDVSPSSWRVQAAILTCKSKTLLLINSYFPVDNQNGRDGVCKKGRYRIITPEHLDYDIIK